MKTKSRDRTHFQLAKVLSLTSQKRTCAIVTLALSDPHPSVSHHRKDDHTWEQLDTLKTDISVERPKVMVTKTPMPKHTVSQEMKTLVCM